MRKLCSTNKNGVRHTFAAVSQGSVLGAGAPGTGLGSSSPCRESCHRPIAVDTSSKLFWLVYPFTSRYSWFCINSYDNT